MDWVVILAKERELIIPADNINEVTQEANAKKTTEERIVSIRIKAKKLKNDFRREGVRT